MKKTKDLSPGAKSAGGNTFPRAGSAPWLRPLDADGAVPSATGYRALFSAHCGRRLWFAMRQLTPARSRSAAAMARRLRPLAVIFAILYHTQPATATTCAGLAVVANRSEKML